MQGCVWWRCKEDEKKEVEEKEEVGCWRKKVFSNLKTHLKMHVYLSDAESAAREILRTTQQVY